MTKWGDAGSRAIRWMGTGADLDQQGESQSMNWYRGLLRLWVGGAAVLIALVLYASAHSAIYSPQTNDGAEMLTLAGVLLVIALFGAWVLRGFKPAK